MGTLNPHEETIPRLLQSVTDELIKSELQRDPIIVDPKLNLVLDGMHRLRALRDSKAKYALCGCFNYSNRKVILQRWLRRFAHPTPRILAEIAEFFGLEESENPEIATQSVDGGKSTLALLSRVKSFTGKKSRNVAEQYHRIGKFDSIAQRRKIRIDYVPDSDGHGNVPLTGPECVLYPVPISKKDVLRAARTGNLFPYKTTRHVFPIRPMGINFPLGLLKQDDIEICERKLVEITSERKMEIVGKGYSYENRTYSERLAIFLDSK